MADEIPNVDPDTAQRELQAVIAGHVVIASPNVVLPAGEFETYALGAVGGGVSPPHILGWRRAEPHERQANYRGIWDGDVRQLEGLGRPPWLNVPRLPGGVGSLSALLHDQHGRFNAEQAAAEARAPAGPRPA